MSIQHDKDNPDFGGITLEMCRLSVRAVMRRRAIDPRWIAPSTEEDLVLETLAICWIMSMTTLFRKPQAVVHDIADKVVCTALRKHENMRPLPDQFDLPAPDDSLAFVDVVDAVDAKLTSNSARQFLRACLEGQSTSVVTQELISPQSKSRNLKKIILAVALQQDVSFEVRAKTFWKRPTAMKARWLDDIASSDEEKRIAKDAKVLFREFQLVNTIRDGQLYDAHLNALIEQVEENRVFATDLGTPEQMAVSKWDEASGCYYERFNEKSNSRYKALNLYGRAASRLLQAGVRLPLTAMYVAQAVAAKTIGDLKMAQRLLAQGLDQLIQVSFQEGVRILTSALRWLLCPDSRRASFAQSNLYSPYFNVMMAGLAYHVDQL